MCIRDRTRDTAYLVSGFARRENDATNGEEEETNDALDANALGARETRNPVPTGPSKRAVLSAYIPKRRDRRHTRKTTPPKLEKPKNAAAAAPRAPPPARSGDLFADFAFAGTQKKNNL